MHVLVVEDEPKIAAFIQRGLTEEGYAVDIAADGVIALERLKVEKYDFIVLDILLPRLNGVQVCRELRRLGVHTPVLMLTARDGVDERVAGLDSGADDYLVKPFAFKELLARLRALSRRPPTAAATTLSVADLSLDPATHQVRRGMKRIELTAKEYAVLELLLRHQGQTLSREQIANHVWSYDFYSESNLVDVYIRSLRRKLDEGFHPRLLHTVRGFGYRLAEVEA
ncbi:MAG: DNA-binding response regulator [Candidatus Chloroheliales bacterium]|nr:MAG: DNA-binding response regulator [Chloroflexota bacterium]